MKNQKILSLFLSILMLIGSLPQAALAAEDEKTQREIYLHGFEQPDLSETLNRSTVYKGEETDIYFAVDMPNKGTSETPQYNLQGYTVKIYFDTRYFKPVNDTKSAILDYTIPNKDKNFTIPDEGDIDKDPSAVENPGYMLYAPDYYKADRTDENTWSYIKATIFLMGNGSFPYGEENEGKWYNLCKLALEPVRTGKTYVKLECDNSDDLRLYAKNKSEDDALTFDCAVQNDGYFYLDIVEKDKPTPPYPDSDHPAGVYNEAIEISLQHDNKENGAIYYTRDGSDPISEASSRQIFTAGDKIDIAVNTKIRTRFLREDGKWSDVRDYEYTFLPHKPYLFNSLNELIPTNYNEIWSETGYLVNTADTQEAGVITDGTSIYYTFNTKISKDEINTENPASDSEKGWVKAGRSGEINEYITKDRTIRLCAVNKWGKSDIAEYLLGIKPDVVTATPDSGLDREQPVTLSCTTPDAQIYYTLNDGDPRMNGTLYTEPLDLKENTVIKAVAKYKGKWGDVSSFWYVFTGMNQSGVYAYHPSGVYTGSVDVTLYPYEAGKEIEISYDGGGSFSLYDGKTMTIKNKTSFRARIKTDDPNDLGEEFLYIIKPENPVFSPESTQFTSTGKVLIFSPEITDESYELWYTTDGSEPTQEDAAKGMSVEVQITDTTQIKAVIVKDGEWKSDVVEHNYSIVYNKPAKPVATLKAGFYIREIGSDEFTTLFEKVPEGTEIYYTIGMGENAYVPDPDVRNVGNEEIPTYKYDESNPIKVIDTMTIKAVAVRKINGVDVYSDVACFYYRITPAMPTAAPSAAVSELPIVPVEAVAVEKTGSGTRCIIRYVIGNENDGYIAKEFVNDVPEGGDIAEYSKFYIDTKTGIAYRKLDNGVLSEPLTESDKQFTETVILRLSADLDGVKSGENAYVYVLDESEERLVTPYADKKSREYEENKNGFEINLYSIYPQSEVKIRWKFAEDDSWTDYADKKPVINEFSKSSHVLYIQNVSLGNSDLVSDTAGYVYYFVPPAPEINPNSGAYKTADNEKISIKRSPELPENGKYILYYMQSGDSDWGSKANGDFENYTINATKTVKAYIKNDKTGKISKVVHKSYIALDESALGAAVSIEYPFSKSRISAHRLGKGDYAKGVIFNPLTGVMYEYSYNLTAEAGGDHYESDIISFNKNHTIVPTYLMDNMNIVYWIDGNKDETLREHDIDFIHLNVPITTLELPENKKDEYKKNDTYKLINEYYESDENVILYYTTDGSDPTLETSDRTLVKFGEQYGKSESLTKTTTVVRAVYFSACGEDSCEACSTGKPEECKNSDYCEEGTYKYTIPSVVYSGGGGGGGSRGGTTTIIDNSRKFTKDMFGVEHPTHISYIKGYPDGSVQPEGKITREEVTSVLYRIMNHEYEEPFVATGDVFPDVKMSRWSALDIEYMADKGVVSGYPDGEFKPQNILTRAEFATLISLFVKLEKTKEENPFVDLEETHWAYENILKLAESGLMEGYEDGTFRAENEITRAEVMVVINKILGRNPSEEYVKSLDFNPYTDLEKSKWYYTAVLEATITHDYYLDDNDVEIKWENCK